MDRDSNISTLITSPPPISAQRWRRGPLRLKEMGASYPLIARGDGFEWKTDTSPSTFAAYERAAREEPVIKTGINMIALSLIAKKGKYIHPNPNIQAFVRFNFPENSLDKLIYKITTDILKFGRYVGEPIYYRIEGPRGIPQIGIKDILHYHPVHIRFILNESGRLAHGEAVSKGSFTKSGIWVPGIKQDWVRLPVDKFIHVTHGPDPVFGESILTSVLDYHLLKRAFIDLLAVALDRHGTPLIYAVVPPQRTNQMVEENGELRAMTLQEATAERLENLRSESAIVFTQEHKDQPVEIKALTTGNNFSDAFQTAIAMCDDNMNRGLGIPNLIMKDSNQGLGSSGSSERQVEMFHHFVQAIYNNVIGCVLQQLIAPLVRYNFDQDRASNNVSNGYFAAKPIRWTETKVLIEGIDKMTSQGYISNKDPLDVQFVRDMLYFPTGD